jgi:hypothetical protein
MENNWGMSGLPWGSRIELRVDNASPVVLSQDSGPLSAYIVRKYYSYSCSSNMFLMYFFWIAEFQVL